MTRPYTPTTLTAEESATKLSVWEDVAVNTLEQKEIHESLSSKNTSAAKRNYNVAFSCDFGDVVRLHAYFTTSEDEPLDPQSLKVYTKAPDNIYTTYTGYNPGPIIRVNEGDFYLDVIADKVGTWFYRWEASGIGKSAAEQNFIVKPSKFTSMPSPQVSATMDWKGAYQTGLVYTRNQVVRDGKYLAVCVSSLPTTMPPSPSMGTVREWALPQSPSFNNISANEEVIWLGLRVNGQVGFYLSNVRYWDLGPAYTSEVAFDVLLRMNPGTTSQSTIVLLQNTSPSQSSGWVLVQLDQPIMILPGDIFDLILVVKNQSGHTDTILSYNYKKSGQIIAGDILHANSATGILDVAKIGQASANNAAFLATVDVGWHIELPGDSVAWEVTSKEQTTDSFRFGIVPSTQATTVGVKDFTFREFTPAPLTTPVLTSYWLNHPTNEGFVYRPDTGLLAMTQNAFGIDFESLDMIISPDWEIMATLSR